MFADCDPGFLDALCTEVRPQICLPGDYIVRQGDIGFEVFFISSGVAEAVDATGKVYSRMAQGSFFGEIALFTLCPRSLSVVSRSMMELYSLHKVWRGLEIGFEWPLKQQSKSKSFCRRKCVFMFMLFILIL
jgi:signal-transduction protein with cAMP-binding, CBS, and nucleotidyltransferase domain